MVSWTTHDLLSLDWDRWTEYHGAHEVMNGALAQVLDALGYRVWPFGLGGAWIVTGRARDKEAAPVNGTDRAIRVSTAVAVLGVAGIAAYVSYWHAYEVVRAHGESGVTARLEPATIDGLVYSSSMVILYAARHRLTGPALARWLLALGIVATLAANVAHGWSHGPVGATVAAWPAASLVGSYEFLLWLIRTAAAGTVAREPAADQPCGPADRPVARLRLVPVPATDAAVHRGAPGNFATAGGPDDPCVGTTPDANRTSGRGRPDMGQAYRPAGQGTTDRSAVNGANAAGEGGDENTDGAAVAAYRASVVDGRPLSERKLAAMFGKTSRRWARNRMVEARQALVSANADNRQEPPFQPDDRTSCHA